jgi:hypothetical protein
MVEGSPSERKKAVRADTSISGAVNLKSSDPPVPKVIYHTPHNASIAPEEEEERERSMGSARIQRMLHRVNNTISQQSERIDAIDSLCNEFDHFDKAKHNEALNVCADEILFQKLTFAIMTGDRDHQINPGEMDRENQKANECHDEEIALICCAIEMVYRGSRDAVQKSMTNIGMNMAPVLSQLLNQKAISLAKKQVSKSSTTVSRNQEEDVRDELCSDVRNSKNIDNEKVTRAIVARVIKILRSFARAGTESQRKCLLNQKDLVGCIFGIITLRKYNKTFKRNEDSEIVADALSLIAFLAENDNESNLQSVLTLVDTKGLINIILWAAANDKDARVRSQAAFATMNLVKVPRCRLSENQQIQLLDTLLALFDDVEDEPRKYAGAALFNLACSQEYNLLLASHQNGAFFDALVRILRKDPNLKSRSNAAWVAFYIFSGKAAVAQMVGNHCELLDTLADGVCHDDSLVKVPAAKALRKLADLVTSNMACHGALLAALVKAADGGHSNPNSPWDKPANVAVRISITSDSHLLGLHQRPLTNHQVYTE